MAEIAPLRNMVSHRVTLDYDTGVRIVGYLTACKPATGPVAAIALARAEILDSEGKVVDNARELLVVPGSFVGIRVTEGPGGF